jgi:hypothetical protein
MARMVGGTFGVAALGALITAVGRHDLERSLPHVPAGTRERMVEALGSGAAPGGGSPEVKAAAMHAFVDALGNGLALSAAAAAVAAGLAWTLIAPGLPQPAPAAAVTDAA